MITNDTTAVRVSNLSKYYDKFCAVSGVSFSVQKGEIFGILGPNGAGKTTSLEMIEGLIKPDNGSIYICDMDIKHQYQKIKEIIGVQPQQASLYNKIKVYEVINLFASYYKKSQGLNYILKLLSLTDKKYNFFDELSGGQKQRLSLGLAIINDPKVIFLDEPTSGVDPHARRNIWNIIKEMKQSGKAVILTTHYMEEAQNLCDRIAIMNKSKIIDMDTPKNLIKKNKLQSSIRFPNDREISEKELYKLQGVTEIISSKKEKTIFTTKPMKTLDALISLAQTKKTKLKHITIKEPNLEDLFLELTGQELIE